MSLKSQGCLEVTENSIGSDSNGILSESYVSDTLLQQVIAERNALRTQNDQLWKIIEKQRTIIQQLQKVSSKNSALLRQQIAEKRSLEEFGVSTLKLNSSPRKYSHLRKDSSESFGLEPLSPNSLDSHTSEMLLQFDLSKKLPQVDNPSNFNSSVQHISNEKGSVIAHTRTISLDTENPEKLSPIASPKTRLRRSLTSPLPMNLLNASQGLLVQEMQSAEPERSKPSKPFSPPSPLSFKEEILEKPIHSKINAPLSPLFPSPILRPCEDETQPVEDVIEESSPEVITETLHVSQDHQESANDEAVSTLSDEKASITGITDDISVSCRSASGNSRLTLNEFGPEYVEKKIHPQDLQESIEPSEESLKNSDIMEKDLIAPESPVLEHVKMLEPAKEACDAGESIQKVEVDVYTSASIPSNLILTGHKRDGSITAKLPLTSNPTPDPQSTLVSECKQIETILSSEVFKTERSLNTDRVFINSKPILQDSLGSQKSSEDTNTNEGHTNELSEVTPELASPPLKTLTPVSSQESFSKTPHNLMSPPIIESQSSPTVLPRSLINNPGASPTKSLDGPQDCQLNTLIGVDIRVTGSTVQINSKGKEVLAFLISVGKRSGFTKFHELWTVEKYYSDFLALDAKLKRTQPRNVVLRVGKLPDRTLFFTHAPSRVDQRKMALQKYLQHLISLNLNSKDDICEFLSTNVSAKVRETKQVSGIKEGYLTKRGKNFGGWKRRYFELKSPIFQYYEAKEGSHLGSINIPQCQVSNQSTSMGVGDTPYRHAFVIIEPKKNGSGVNRHILCADSDIERDEWVSTLNFYTHRADPNVTPLPSTSAVISEAESESSRSGSQISAKKGGKLRNLIRNDSPKASNSGRVSSPVSRTQSPIPPPSPSRSPNGVNHRYAHSLETNNQGHMMMSSINRVKAESSNSSDVSKSIHRKSTSFKERLLNSSSSSSPPPPVPLFPIKTDNSTIDPSPLSPSRSKKPFGGGFIGNKPSKEKENNTSRKRTPFGWGKKIFSGGDSKSRAPSVPIFGSPLEMAVEASRVKDGYELPAVVHRCIEYLDSKGAHKEEGIYRLSGSTATVRTLKDKFNAEGDYNILRSGVYYDVHAVSGVLKLYLRELPISVLTRARHSEFLHVTDLLNRRERVNELGRLISTLPLANYTILRCLIAHLIRIVQNSDINKMTVRNIGIVFSPTLGIPAGVFNLLMTEFEYIFWINDDGCAAPRKIECSEGEEEVKPVINKNDDERTLKIDPTAQPESTKPNTLGLEGISTEEGVQPPRRHPQIRAFLQDQIGRSNRNSVIYADSAPQEFVKMEKTLQGSHTGFECEEEDLYDLVPPTGASVSDTSCFMGSPETNECYLNLGGDSQSMNDSEYSYDPTEVNSVDEPAQYTEDSSSMTSVGYESKGNGFPSIEDLSVVPDYK